jgi:hypothetical protein
VLLRTLFIDALGKLAAVSGANDGYLSRFEELLAIDAAVIRLHDWLSRHYAACRTNHSHAAAKLYMRLESFSGVRLYRAFAETRGQISLASSRPAVGKAAARGVTGRAAAALTGGGRGCQCR